MRAMRVFDVDKATPRSSPAPHTSDVGEGEEGEEDIVEVSADEVLLGKEIFRALF